jgi:hypothetical protein
MRWDMEDLRNLKKTAPDTSFEGEEQNIYHLQEAKQLLGGFAENMDAIDVLMILLAAANELGKDRVKGWDIAEAANIAEEYVGTIDLMDLGPNLSTNYVMTSE